MARTKGATNKPADAVLRGHTLSVYRALGGKKWLLEYAKRNPEGFLKHLSKYADPPKESTQLPQEPQTGVLTDEKQAAMRIAFVMAKALHDAGEPLVVEGEIVEPAPPSWMPADQDQPVVEQPALPAPEPVLEEAKPARRSLADLLGIEPPIEPSLYGGGVNQYRSGDAAEQGGGRRDLIGDVRVVQARETVADKYRRMKGG